MTTIELTIQQLSVDNFSKFGEVITTKNNDYVAINNGYAKKYADLITTQTQQNQNTALHIFTTKQRKFPLTIDMLEKHPNFTQAFIAQSDQPFLVVVAPQANTPDTQQIQAFITDGTQGVNYYAGTWHFPLISLSANQSFIVLDQVQNKSQDDNCIEYQITDTQILINSTKAN